ncbi:MAG: hypothetical protein HY721_07645 [Planctomycetes bacterium]|nr:hypothetical protein [Planctomycetota bacterium]
MKTYLYLSLMPEALIASMLSPEEFGCYYAVGTKKRSRGQAVFFEVDPALRSDYFPLDTIAARCVPHADGQPKRSVYLSVYRVLENVPLEALGRLYLVTDDGRVLGLQQGLWEAEDGRALHLYQELCPVTPLISSMLDPGGFGRFITDPAQPVFLPKIVFVELVLNRLDKDPLMASANNLPYSQIDHIRDCLVGLLANPEKPTKTVTRYMRQELLYRTIKNGVFVAGPQRLLYYPMPSRHDLESKHYTWWRSALTVGFEL